MSNSAVVAGSGQTGGSGGTPLDNINNGLDDFNTFRPLEDSPLNVDPEEAGEVADTDNYRGPSENAILQDINEALADIDPVAPEEIQEEVTAALEGLRLLPMLQEYQRHFKKRGVGIADVAALESHYPGMLLTNAPASYSYKPSMVNIEYSQEAIGEKISGLVKRGKAALDKLIKWVITKFANFRAKLSKEHFKRWVYRMFVILENNPNDILNRHDAMQLLRARTDVWDRSPQSAGVSEILGLNQDPPLMLNLLYVRDLSTAKGYLEWLDHESTVKTRMPYDPGSWEHAARETIITLKKIRGNNDMGWSAQGDIAILDQDLHTARYRFSDLDELDGRDKQWIESSYDTIGQIEQGLKDTQRKLDSSTELTDVQYKDLTTVVNNCVVLLTSHRQYMKDVTTIFNWIRFTQEFLKRDNLLALAKEQEAKRTA